MSDMLSFSDYQRRARATERLGSGTDKATITYLLGLAGEAGGLLSEYKKYIRDGERHKLFGKGAAEEIGDTLWYLSAVASQLGIDLEDAARQNLAKVGRRYADQLGAPPDYDSQYKDDWRIPRRFDVHFNDSEDAAVMMIDGVQLGDPLRDNTVKKTGYRFHDVFHLSYASVLGWSPVLRGIMVPKRKRRAPGVEHVQDGGRAIVAEEGIALLVYSVAEKHCLYKDVSHVDTWLLDVIGRMVEGYEVEDRSPYEWEYAILSGYEVFRELVEHAGGIVSCNLDERTIRYARPS